MKGYRVKIGKNQDLKPVLCEIKTLWIYSFFDISYFSWKLFCYRTFIILDIFILQITFVTSLRSSKTDQHESTKILQSDESISNQKKSDRS